MILSREIYKIAWVFVLLIFSSEGIFAQKYLNEGNKYFDRNMFEDAIPHYLKELDKGKSYKAKLETRAKLANCYRLTGRFLEANEMYKKIVDRSGRFNKPEHILNYANSLKSSALYAEAAEQFKNYMKLEPDDPMGEIYLQSCDMAQKWLDEKKEFFVMNFESVNTEKSEFAPYYYDDGIVFTSAREDSKKQFISFNSLGNEVRTDLYYLNLIHSGDDQFSVKNMERLNSFLHDGSATFTKDGQTVYFTRTVMGDKNRKTNVVLNSLQVFYSYLTPDNVWATPVSAFSFNDENYSVGQPSLTPDGNQIFFISDMPGGHGATDIYYAELKENGEWGEPINLGEKVNTFGYELFPYAHSKDTLFFSSDTHPGMGKLDIFYTINTDGSWTEPQNMKPPVNSIGDDFGIVMNEKQTRGFFSSDRFNGMGKEDLYTLYREEPLELTFDGNVIKIPDHEIYSGITYKISVEGSDKTESLESENGVFSYRLLPDSLYNLTLRKNRFFFDRVGIRLGEAPNKDAYLTELMPRNTPVIVKGIAGKTLMKVVKPDSTSQSDTRIADEKLKPDTLFEFTPEPFTEVALLEDQKEIDRKTTDNEGEYLFNELLTGEHNYQLLTMIKVEEEEEMAESETEQEEEIEKMADHPPSEQSDTLTDLVFEDVPEEIPEEDSLEIVSDNTRRNNSDTLLTEETDIPGTKDSLLVAEHTEDESKEVFIENDEIETKIKNDELPVIQENDSVELIRIKGKLETDNNEPVAGGNVKVYDDREMLGETGSDTIGEFKIDVEERDEYLVSVTKKGYFQKQINISKEESALTKENFTVDLEPIRENYTIPVENIFFDFNKSELRPESLAGLNRLTDFLKVNNDITIELDAHTDTRGEYYFNLLLSNKRAEAVKSYLAMHGIQTERIITRGFGESFPAVPEANTEVEHEKNRRVEFRVVEETPLAENTPHNSVITNGFTIFDKCPYSEENPIPFTNDVPDELIFRVKIGEFRNNIPFTTYKGLFPVVKAKDREKNTTEYYAGLFSSLQDAEIAAEIIRKNFSNDAYIVAFNKKERVTIEEAVKIANTPDNNKNLFAENQSETPSFSIQIGAFRRNVRSSTLQKFKEIADDFGLISFESKGNIIYSVGRFNSYEEAFHVKNSLMQKNITNDAFIIALLNGEKISIGEAQRYLSSQNLSNQK